MLTGGRGADDFVFSGNVFSGGTPVPVGGYRYQTLNQPDVLTPNGKDQFSSTPATSASTTSFSRHHLRDR